MIRHTSKELVLVVPGRAHVDVWIPYIQEWIISLDGTSKLEGRRYRTVGYHALHLRLIWPWTKRPIPSSTFLSLPHWNSITQQIVERYAAWPICFHSFRRPHEVGPLLVKFNSWFQLIVRGRGLSLKLDRDSHWILPILEESLTFAKRVLSLYRN